MIPRDCRATRSRPNTADDRFPPTCKATAARLALSRAWRALLPCCSPRGGRARSSRSAARSRPDKNAPIVFQADEVEYDDQLALTVAKGHVEISQGGAGPARRHRHLQPAHRHGHRLRPCQPVAADRRGRLRRFHGAARFDEQRLSPQNVRMLLADRSRLAGQCRAAHSTATALELRRGVYSPCDLCKDDPSAPPAWQFKAREITDDKELKLIEFRDAVIEIDGWPVFYTPYLSQPDPSVKRASGFLTPSLRQLEHARLPCRAPLFLGARARQGPDPRAALHDRGRRAARGANTASASATARSTPSAASTTAMSARAATRNTGEQWRGHVNASGVWDLDETYRTGFAAAAGLRPDLSAALRLRQPAAQRDDQPGLSRRLPAARHRPTSTLISSSR